MKIYITEQQYKSLTEQSASLANELRQASIEMTNSIPKLFKEKVDEYLKNKKLIQFEMNGVKVFIYDSSINKTPTSTPMFPKYIYLNVDYLSDFPKISLMGNSNIYIDLYFAFLHEFEHIENKIPPESMPDLDYQKYINSKSEKLAMEYSGEWLGQYTEPIYKKYNQV